jgi:uncharacterized protein (TIGR02145 family)
MKNIRLIILTLIMVQMNSYLAQNDNSVYLLGQTEDGTKYAMQGSWVRGVEGEIYLKNYCISRIPGKFAYDTTRWEKCNDYMKSGGVLEYEILRKKFIDPNDSTKLLKSMVNATEDSIVFVQKAVMGVNIDVNIDVNNNIQAVGYFFNYKSGFGEIELKSLSKSFTKNNEYVLNELQNEIQEIKYTPYLSLSTGEVEYYTTTSTSFFEPNNLGLVNAFSKSFKIVSQNDGTKSLVPIVTIGKQLWMAENLLTDEFANKEVIPKYEDWNTWSALSTSAYFFHEGNKYYNQAALVDSRNVCPVGFHVPNETDLIDLVKTLSPDQRDVIMFDKKNQLKLNRKSNDLNLNGLISKDVKSMVRLVKSIETSLPTDEYLLGLNATNKILIGENKINFKISEIYLPFINRKQELKQILCLAYSFSGYGPGYANDRDYINRVFLLPYTTVSNENIVTYKSGKVSVEDQRRYISNIENKIGYAVRCIADK